MTDSVATLVEVPQALRSFSQNARQLELYDDAPVGLCIFDSRGYILAANRTAAALLGHRRDEVVGQPFICFAEDIRFDQFWRHLDACLRSGERVELELELRTRRRAPVAVQLVSTPIFDELGRAFACRSALVDVTERRRSIEVLRFRAELASQLGGSLEPAVTVESAASLAVPFLADWCVVRVREQACGCPVGVAHVSPGKLELLREIVRRQTLLQTFAAAEARALQTGQLQLVHEVPEADWAALSTDAARERALRELGAGTVMVLPLQARGQKLGTLLLGAPAGTQRFRPSDMILGQELAASVALALENARLYEQAQRALGLRDEFIAALSHDLGNAAASISMSAHTLLKQMPEQDRRKAGRKQAQRIKSSADWMMNLMRKLLDAAVMERGGACVERAPVGVPALLHDCAEMVQPAAAEKNIRLEVVRAPDAQVLCDRERVQQVLHNLIGNAVKFTKDGGHVSVSAAREGDEVRFCIADDGPGIPPAHLPHIFDRFWRAKRGREAGFGLGLAICKAVVEAHGGRIWAKSQLGVGSTFFFTLTAAPQSDAAPEPSCGSEQSAN